VIFTPWLNGERTPVDDHTVRAGWYNLSLGSTRADQVRSVLEGVAFNYRWLMGAVEGFVGREFDHLHFVGGGAQSDLWCQIQADVLDREIRKVADPIQANARGAALLGGMALGHVDESGLADSVEIERTFRPQRQNRATYDELFGEFKSIYKKTRGIYRRLNR
jgi:xylulokinase